MNVEGIGRIWGIDADRLDDPNYEPDYVSEEENEEILHILESLTEDDLKTAMIVERKLNDPSYRKIIYKDEDFFRELDKERDEEIRKV